MVQTWICKRDGKAVQPTLVARVFIGIGSNLGDRQAHLDLAVSCLRALPWTQVLAKSKTYETQPVGPIAQGPFLNAVAEMHTDLEPLTLLRHLQAIEKQTGRPGPDARAKWGPRTLDLDILFYDDRVLTLGTLRIPHPHLHERGFVLKPMMDLDPQLRHPVLGKTMAELFESWQSSPHG